MKNKLIKFLIFILVVILIPLSLYFYRSSSELSSDHTTWGEFGALYGGVLGPSAALLAFIGLLLSLDLTTKQFRNQSEDTTLFNLINLHDKKVQLIEFEESGGVRITGFQAFKRYSEEFSRIYDNDSIRVARKELSMNTKNLNDNAGEFLWNKYANQFHEDGTFWSDQKTNINKMASLFENNSNPWELQKILIGTDDSISSTDREKLISIGHVVIEDSIPKNRIEIIERVYSLFDQDYGHMLGHYFKHIHYILRAIGLKEA